MNCEHSLACPTCGAIKIVWTSSEYARMFSCNRCGMDISLNDRVDDSSENSVGLWEESLENRYTCPECEDVVLEKLNNDYGFSCPKCGEEFQATDQESTMESLNEHSEAQVSPLQYVVTVSSVVACMAFLYQKFIGERAFLIAVEYALFFAAVFASIFVCSALLFGQWFWFAIGTVAILLIIAKSWLDELFTEYTVFRPFSTFDRFLIDELDAAPNSATVLLAVFLAFCAAVRFLFPKGLGKTKCRIFLEATNGALLFIAIAAMLTFLGFILFFDEVDDAVTGGIYLSILLGGGIVLYKHGTGLAFTGYVLFPILLLMVILGPFSWTLFYQTLDTRSVETSLQEAIISTEPADETNTTEITKDWGEACLTMEGLELPDPNETETYSSDEFKEIAKVVFEKEKTSSVTKALTLMSKHKAIGTPFLRTVLKEMKTGLIRTDAFEKTLINYSEFILIPRLPEYLEEIQEEHGIFLRCEKFVFPF